MCRCVSVRGHAARFLSFVNVLLMRACVHVMFVVIIFFFFFFLAIICLKQFYVRVLR